MKLGVRERRMLPIQSCVQEKRRLVSQSDDSSCSCTLPTMISSVRPLRLLLHVWRTSGGTRVNGHRLGQDLRWYDRKTSAVVLPVAVELSRRECT